MSRFIQTIKNNNLFVKIFVVTVVSIVSVSILITYSSISMSGALFVKTFGITNTKVLNQITTKFESYSYAVVSAAIKVQNNGTIKRVLTEPEGNSLAMGRSAHDILEQMDPIYPILEPYEANMIVLGKNNPNPFNMNYSFWSVSEKQLREHQAHKSALEQPDKILYQYDPGTATYPPMIVTSKALTERSTGNVYGTLFISIKESELQSFYDGYTSDANSILLLDAAGTIISSNLKNKVGEKSTQLLDYSKKNDDPTSTSTYQNVEVFGEKYMLLSKYLPTYDMYLVNLIDTNSLIENLVNPKQIVLISIGIVILAVLVVFIFTRRMTKSLSKLVQQISNMAKYNFSKKVSVSHGYEAKKIASAFNYMLNELHDYVSILIETQKKQSKVELEVLQHQINPHFLYNTLTSVKFMVQQGQEGKATETIDSLISLLQSSLTNINEMIPVKQEVVNLENYVKINHGRYGKQIQVNYFVSPDCRDYLLPKLVLQPFIENAFFHAFSKKKEGYIQVLIARKEDRLVCEVIDNGDGMDTKGNSAKNLPLNFKSKRQLFSGIGVRNVHERIQLLFGKDYGVKISSELDKGTTVVIELPLVNSESASKYITNF
ncbi:cache domain-containing sensor histidine kinase [Aquibacillus kalidii]|uniref:cache domain-containing sensor histidine kinase n=1 Tax=Aquibacillus kalidii TaxID=2762597 RepID=UPI00164543F4|nr:sensor histidine kinase [Aquibacillus kalidii]